MFGKIKDMRDNMKMLKELQSKLGNVDMSSPESMMESMGIDINEIENQFNQSVEPLIERKVPVNYINDSENKNPEYAYDSDSGFDLRSTEDIWVQANDRKLIPTGLRFDIPDGYEIQVRSKSGLALNQGLMVLNSPGTVDCFSDDMKILTIEGEKLISEIKIGELVYSFNEETLEIEKDSIIQLYDTEKQEILIIETETGILEVTPNSEVYTTNGIILAKNLNKNDEIINFF
jgi:dUTP pyrophosphatase